MNCKQGDLAVIVRSRVGNEGRIVRCIAFVGPTRFDYFGVLETEPSPAWRVHPPFPTWDGTLGDIVKDAHLRPLRDNPGQDEILNWLDVPTEETA